ncbi:hypothetical protein N7490_005044 [Penicillium lividum]|nr:hypothetical protein N7490_005044 [Penicillium lividum]
MVLLEKMLDLIHWYDKAVPSGPQTSIASERLLLDSFRVVPWKPLNFKERGQKVPGPKEYVIGEAKFEKILVGCLIRGQHPSANFAA